MDDDIRSVVKKDQYRTSIGKNYNRVLIDNAFPKIGKALGAHEGSQSLAPNSDTTPNYPEPSEAQMAIAKGVMRAKFSERSGGEEDY